MLYVRVLIIFSFLLIIIELKNDMKYFFIIFYKRDDMKYLNFNPFYKGSVAKCSLLAPICKGGADEVSRGVDIIYFVLFFNKTK